MTPFELTRNPRESKLTLLVSTLARTLRRLFDLILVLAALALALECVAQPTPDASSATGDFPLRPADLSSPRDTLVGFLANMNRVIASLRSGVSDQLALRRAAAALNFEATPNGNSWATRVRRLVMLREILRRIDLPPADTVPGDDDVAAGIDPDWTVPGTELTIARVLRGPRAGTFVFTAETVRRLDRDYRQVRGLPFRTGPDKDVYTALFEKDGASASLGAPVERRLRPPATSSPLSTLEQFLESVNQAYALSVQIETFANTTAEDFEALEAASADWMRRAVATLDLSDVPEVMREDAGVEAALQLKEVLDRMALPPLDAIPDALAVVAARNGEGLERWVSDEPLRWRYPNTVIEIVKITEGDRQGEFLFSARTVRDIGGFLDAVAGLPYRKTEGGLIEAKYTSAKISPGFLSMYLSSKGALVPRASLAGQLARISPEPLQRIVLGQPLWKWVAVLTATVICVVAAVALMVLARRWIACRPPPTDAWIALLPPLGVTVLASALGRFIDHGVNVTAEVRVVSVTAVSVVVIAMAAWGAYLLNCAVAESLIATPRMRDDATASNLLRIGARVLGIMFMSAVVVAGLRYLGADVIPLIAGLGVGGLAVALAAQRTFANLIGGMILFANRPIHVGNFFRYGDQVGTVESIGLLSTRIRSLERTIVTVPNAELSEMKLENYSVRDERLLKLTLQLRYETTPEQMRYVLVRVREMLIAHPKVSPNPARVRFSAFGPYSKDFEVFAYLRCSDENVFCELKEDVLLRIDEIVAESGTGFAFPSQTVYLARDGGRDLEQSAAAESRVAEWRAKRKLPFPEFEEVERERMEDTLDYPPPGSPAYRSRI